MNEKGGKRAIAAGLMLGFGLGSFLDVILLHLILGWHNLVSSAVPPRTVDAARASAVWDGLLPAFSWALTVAGLVLLLGAPRRAAVTPSATALAGLLLTGWGLFNLFDSVVNHYTLGIHHVKGGTNAAVYDLEFFAVGGVLFTLIGAMLARTGRHSMAGRS